MMDKFDTIYAETIDDDINFDTIFGAAEDGQLIESVDVETFFDEDGNEIYFESDEEEPLYDEEGEEMPKDEGCKKEEGCVKKEGTNCKGKCKKESYTNTSDLDAFFEGDEVVRPEDNPDLDEPDKAGPRPQERSNHPEDKIKEGLGGCTKEGKDCADCKEGFNGCTKEGKDCADCKEGFNGCTKEGKDCADCKEGFNGCTKEGKDCADCKEGFNPDAYREEDDEIPDPDDDLKDDSDYGDDIEDDTEEDETYDEGLDCDDCKKPAVDPYDDITVPATPTPASNEPMSTSDLDDIMTYREPVNGVAEGENCPECEDNEEDNHLIDKVDNSDNGPEDEATPDDFEYPDAEFTNADDVDTEYNVGDTAQEPSTIDVDESYTTSDLDNLMNDGIGTNVGLGSTHDLIDAVESDPSSKESDEDGEDIDSVAGFAESFDFI